MKRRNWRQVDLARESGHPPQTINGLLRYHRVGPEIAVNVARAFGFPVERGLIEAGFLPPKTEDQLEEDEIAYLFRQLHPADQELVTDIIRRLAER